MSNYAHRYYKSAKESSPELWMDNPYDDLKAGDVFDGSHPSTFACGDIESIHDSTVYRIFDIRTDANVLVTARLRHSDKGAGWVIRKPELTQALVTH